ncbi:hypothetical protein PanWU01x14_032580 [Parasponia andersonii]|uniref:Uncharacterized protein n=1 Tax=Parasponia andersonii TaxID=3476 RepID=A0A2P5DTH5_PARAD|nr:hypothetical protein PanWU01x14_032580 [Parasponia andersonii]
MWCWARRYSVASYKIVDLNLLLMGNSESSYGHGGKAKNRQESFDLAEPAVVSNPILQTAVVTVVWPQRFQVRRTLSQWKLNEIRVSHFHFHPLILQK